MRPVGGQLVISLAAIVDRAGEAFGDLDVRLSPSDWREVTGVPLTWSVSPEAFFKTEIAGREIHFFSDPSMEDGQIEIQGNGDPCLIQEHKM